MENEKEIKSVFRRLKIMREDYCDIIPNESVNSASKNNRYKCRKGWWTMMRNEFDVLEEIKILPENLIQNYRGVWKKYLMAIDENDYGIKPENIIEANALIDQTLSLLETKLS
jgi:hypothetical protein